MDATVLTRPSSIYCGAAMKKRKPIKRRPIKRRCVACGGTGVSSKKGRCVPCGGTGWTKPK